MNAPAFTVRLDREEMKRFDKACRAKHQSKTAFAVEAILRSVTEFEEGRVNNKMYEKRLRSESSNGLEDDDEVDSSKFPVGMGLVDALRQRDEREAEARAAASPAKTTSPVTVNVGGSSQVGGDMIDHLATYVVSGHDFERSHRLREAVRMLHVSTETPEERAALSSRLDEAIAAKKKTNNDGVAHVARVAYDKLLGLLGSE